MLWLRTEERTTVAQARVILGIIVNETVLVCACVTTWRIERSHTNKLTHTENRPSCLRKFHKQPTATWAEETNEDPTNGNVYKRVVSFRRQLTRALPSRDGEHKCLSSWSPVSSSFPAPTNKLRWHGRSPARTQVSSPTLPPPRVPLATC